MKTQMEREEQNIEDRYDRGEISTEQYNIEMEELLREYRAVAEERAQKAYDAEMESWEFSSRW